MVKETMSFGKFLRQVEVVFENIRGIQLKRQPADYKRGALIVEQMGELEGLFEILRAEAPPVCFGEEAEKRLSRERTGNPIWFHKVRLPGFKFIKMTDKEALQWMSQRD